MNYQIIKVEQYLIQPFAGLLLPYLIKSGLDNLHKYSETNARIR